MDGSTAQGRAGGQGGFEPTPQIIDMASTEELVEAIYRLIASSPTPIPVTLMNHGVDETAAIIGAVVCESAFEFDPSYLRQFKKLPRRSAFGPHAE